MMLAAQKAYGDDAAQLIGGVPFGTVLQAQVLLRRIQGNPPEINGTTAIIRTQIPDSILNAAPADAQQNLIQWLGKPIYFQLQNGSWRIDMDRSIRFVVKIQRKGSSNWVQASDGLATQIVQEQGRADDLITQRINSGQLPTVSDAKTAKGMNWNHLSSKFGIDGLNTYSAPALPEQP
jgi:hypothetical protein